MYRAWFYLGVGNTGRTRGLFPLGDIPQFSQLYSFLALQTLFKNNHQPTYTYPVCLFNFEKEAFFLVCLLLL